QIYWQRGLKIMISQEKRFATESLNKLIWAMVMPAFMAQLINALYNIVDRVYIGRIPGEGELALTGLGLTFPILQIVVAMSAFAGSGGAPLASRYLGRQDYNKAKDILQTSATLLIIFSIILTVVFYIAKEPLLYLFGASEHTAPYADAYLSIYLLGTIFVQFSVGLNPFISGQGNAKIAMFSTLIGAVINIILDPIFIFVFDMGVQGAAIATVISQAASAIWIVRYLTSDKSVVRLDFKKLGLKKDCVMAIVAIGISPVIMQSTNSLVNIVLNSSFQHYGGDMYVGAMTILSSIATMQFIPIDAVRQGVIPILAYNYGARNKKRLIAIMKRLLIFTTAASMVTSIVVLAFPELFVAIFSSNSEMVDLASGLARVYFLGTPLFGVIMATQGCFIAFGFAKSSIFIALLRKIIILIPFALILPHFYGVMGIVYAQPLADIGATITAGTALIIAFRWIIRTMEDESASKIAS
ncbi:MATE family efflux transporter, partial [Candidatus Epulonipiscium viviparus]|uniref:MATE family efflux transporter n=1 Tax=Candidatus Epulonipiscium viviparus TaxID=420336 RepID=UPI00016C0B73